MCKFHPQKPFAYPVSTSDGTQLIHVVRNVDNVCNVTVLKAMTAGTFTYNRKAPKCSNNFKPIIHMLLVQG